MIYSFFRKQSPHDYKREELKKLTCVESFGVMWQIGIPGRFHPQDGKSTASNCGPSGTPTDQSWVSELGPLMSWPIE